MFRKFEQLNEEKRERIINAALMEFAERGYDKASTNTIVKQAEISKGLLFHYFGNKASLFMYLSDYCSELIIKDLYENLDLEDKDILNRIHEIMLRKVILLKRHPRIFEFVKNIYREPNLEMKEKVIKKQQQITEESKTTLFKNIDYSYFKKGLDIEKTMFVIYSTLEKISMSEIIKENMNIDEVVREIETYFDYFREVFYEN